MFTVLTKVNINIQEEIKRLCAVKLHELSVGAFDLIEDLVKEARSDIRDYDALITNSESDIRLDTNDNPIIRHESGVQLKSENKLDTWALKKVSKGKDDLIILGKLVDHIVPIEFAPSLKNDINNLGLTSQ